MTLVPSVTWILGHRLFQGKHFSKRLVGAVVMVAGAVLIILGR